MEINEIARKSISEKFLEAIKREGLGKSEAAALLGMTPDYVSKLLNAVYRKDLSDNVIFRFQNFVNSGDNLREYSEKMKLVLDKGVHQPTVDETKKPPEKIEGNVSTDEVREMLDDWAKDLEDTEAILESKTTDRMAILLETLEEFKDLGYEVDIHISRP